MRYFAVVLLVFIIIAASKAQDLKALEKTDDIKSIMTDAKGKVILLNFWASWCAPCVKEFPELVKLYRDYKDKNFSIVFISLDDLSDIDPKVKPFLQKQGVDFTTYYNKFSKPEELIDYIDKNWQGGIPSTYIYDKEGIMKTGILGGRKYSDFESEIKKYLD